MSSISFHAESACSAAPQASQEKAAHGESAGPRAFTCRAADSSSDDAAGCGVLPISVAGTGPATTLYATQNSGAIIPLLSIQCTKCTNYPKHYEVTNALHSNYPCTTQHTARPR